MLLRKRHKEILRLLANRKSVTLQELMEEFSASESTIRRDLTALHKEGKLVKAVSYTHLDVYKRQWQCCGSGRCMDRVILLLHYAL